jgi:hypothetical protein
MTIADELQATIELTQGFLAEETGCGQETLVTCPSPSGRGVGVRESGNP